MTLPRTQPRDTHPQPCDAGSMPLALLLTFVGMGLTALLVPVVVGQVHATNSEVRRGHALAAAQTGLDVALGRIRAANDGAGNGVLVKLPCGPIAGRVAAAGTSRYLVSIYYLKSDPQGRSADAIKADTGNQITCDADSDSLVKGPAELPGFAWLESVGTDSRPKPDGPGHPADLAADHPDVPVRKITATYRIITSAQIVGGGLIRAYSDSAGSELCLDAESGSPSPGSPIRVRACDARSVTQRFVYNANLTMMLVASRTEARPRGMCLSTTLPRTAGQPVLLQECALATSPPQQWIFNEYGNFESTADGAAPDGFCLNVQTPGVPSAIVLGSATDGNCRAASNAAQTFTPESAAGAGAAQWSGQVVNYGEYSRCAAVTNADVTYPYLVAWPCQQTTNPAAVTWGQKWTLPALQTGKPYGTGLIKVEAPDPANPAGPKTPYCLRSPGSTGPLQYLTLTSCPSGDPPPNLSWTVYRNTGVSSTSYVIKDNSGYCLAPTDPLADAVSRDLHEVDRQISKLVVAACDGSGLQKWNAPPNTVQTPPLKDLRER